MKYFFCALFFFSVTISPASSQGNPNEAKAAYLLAEESFGKGDYKGTLEYLEQVKTSLGTTNCKILYLQIMTLKELATKDKTSGNKLAAAVAEFEKAPDYASFNEEKAMEVMKLKLELKRQASLDAEASKAFLHYQQKTGRSIGMSADSVILLRKTYFNFYFKAFPQKNGKLDSNESISVIKPDGSVSEGITLKNGKLDQYIQYLFMHTAETADFGLANQKLPQILEEMKHAFGYLPEAVDRSNPQTLNVKLITYTWASNDAKAVLYIYYQTSSSGKSSHATFMLSGPKGQ